MVRRVLSILIGLTIAGQSGILHAAEAGADGVLAMPVAALRDMLPLEAVGLGLAALFAIAVIVRVRWRMARISRGESGDILGADTRAPDGRAGHGQAEGNSADPVLAAVREQLPDMQGDAAHAADAVRGQPASPARSGAGDTGQDLVLLGGALIGVAAISVPASGILMRGGFPTADAEQGAAVDGAPVPALPPLDPVLTTTVIGGVAFVLLAMLLWQLIRFVGPVGRAAAFRGKDDPFDRLAAQTRGQ